MHQSLPAAPRSGRALAAGAPLNEVGFVYGWKEPKHGEKAPKTPIRHRLKFDRKAFYDGMLKLLFFPKITIVQAHGYLLGVSMDMYLGCDFIIAADNARFGQPEITIGTIPGFGGSQRLAGLVGKSKAMDMCLTGRMMDAEEAERAGLAARVIPAERLMKETLAAAETIANYSKMAAIVAREAVERALEVGLHEGTLFERRTYYALWATQDANEGMQAFIEKREPIFNGK